MEGELPSRGQETKEPQASVAFNTRMLQWVLSLVEDDQENGVIVFHMHVHNFFHSVLRMSHSYLQDGQMFG